MALPQEPYQSVGRNGHSPSRETRAGTGTRTFTDQREVKAVFGVVPEPSCPLRAVGTDVGDIRIQLEEEGCQCDFIYAQTRDGVPGVTHTETDGCEDCACHIFQDIGCVPEVIGREDEQVLIETFVGDESTAWGLIEKLNNKTVNAELHRIETDIGFDLQDTSTGLDLSVLTEKQREALDTAIESGYYCRPRETSLSEIARQFDISKQALGQRLARAEEKVMEQLGH